MNPLTVAALALGASSLLVLLWADQNDKTTVRAAAKTLCSLGFLLLAWGMGLDGPFDYLLFCGLLLSFLGDVLLLGRRDGFFLGGLVAFLLAHVVYTLAFSGQSSFPTGWLGAVGLASSAFLVWLWPRLGSWRVPVLAYCAVISLMLWSALGVGDGRVWLGALLFFLSDIFVARGRFVRQDRWNTLLGLPLYYLGQYLLAWAAG